MVGKQMESDSFTSNFSGMSKNQLYGIMSQMKILIEQNQQQARHILVENPTLTKALFQAQILLGMVKPPKVIPSVQQAPSQPLSQQPVHLQSVQAQSVPIQAGSQDQATAVQIQIPASKQSNHPSSTMPSTSVPPGTYQSMPSHHQQSLQPAKAHMGTQGMSMSNPQFPQVHNIAPRQHQSTQQPPLFHQSQRPITSNHPQHTQHSSVSLHPMQPPLPQQSRPPAVQPFQHQLHPQMRPHSGFQTSAASQPHLQHQQFSGANRHPGNVEFGQRPPPIPNQPPPLPRYQGSGSHLGPDFNNQGGGGPMQVDRAPWMPGPPENPTGGSHLPGPPPLPTQVGPGIQPPRPQTTSNELSPILQQIMNLTPEQINCLPPAQRQQVFQLQQMLR